MQVIMNNKYNTLRYTKVISDLMILNICWILAYFIRFYTTINHPQGIPPLILYIKLVPFISFFWISSLIINGTWQRLGQFRAQFRESLETVQTILLSILLIITFTYFYEEYRYSRLTLLIFSFLLIFSIPLGRSICRKIIRLYLRNTDHRKALIIGSDSNLKHSIDLITSNKMEKYEIVGVIDSESTPKAPAWLTQNMPWISKPSDWASYLTSKDIQTIFVALPQNSNFSDSDLAEISNQISDIKIIPDIRKFSQFSSGIEIFNGTPIFQIHESPLNGLGLGLKRSIDVLGSFVGIMLLSPVMLIISCMVKMSSRGPIFYKQERMGVDGKIFSCLKFRSMPIDAEAKTGAIWSSLGDNRSTPIGKILRRTSLDEIPQLFNVLAGDMSLVGPRPERPVFVNDFRKHVPGYMLRHKVKAGITGWAQVNGWRGNTSIEKRIEHDLYYIKNWTIWLDIKILLLTIEELRSGRNAY
ncbi:MAG: undecaprenyl-phosphate glucose phosphotransferase [Zetaproteobacteria bacterium]|nr:undecaprenyl-phosphate glucose phosphotransferase [Pseudobdellovibrionaceae bacterium]